MIAEFAIYPMGKVHYSQTIAKVIQEIKKSGLQYRVGPMGTSIEGETDEVFRTLQNCFRLVYQDHDRVIMNVSVDNKQAASLHELDERVESVLKKVS